MELKGKIAFITGASSGIGFGIALSLQKAGCQIIINSSSKKNLNTAKKKLPGSIAISVDVTCPNQSKKLIKNINSKSL